ncbi:hypothetical protein BHU72_07790 [Desulfuribacillus stibiiarsenatis]|uniref:Zinc finger DksA/TraR C4-type domain-containing protein n=1 Tax=Desulfuribacillus stibiiarsenatis TaxID=1390249 RepID=A0A1E5L3K9_9FIRM|nr:TraR/DksA C4-type zinc finger protein [Desulfuribacillus stibiiarsenatis]OEH84728.1 hypothetical protein BHU72_07790 [Desulfuribacillus stibiiarsenatis]
MDRDLQQHFQSNLSQTLQELQSQVTENDGYGLKDALNDSIGELSSYDNHPADIASEVFERGKDLAIKEETLKRISLIENALKRMEQGSYGICERCNQMISTDRLVAVPETGLCYQCHEQMDAHNRPSTRPIEEDVLYPGFGAHDYDNSNHETEFDSEDSWQAVAEYGTSNDATMLGGETNYNEMYEESHENEKHYHIEYNYVYVDPNEDDYTDEDIMNATNDLDFTGVSNIEQQAYQEYLRNQHEH